MKRFSEQFKKQAESVRLKATERRDLRERVVSYMEYHPLPNKDGVAARDGVHTEPVHYLRINGWLIARWGSICALLMVVVVPMLAERAVPGDVLYAVKVRVNEEVRGTLTRTPYEKVAWETERLNRRIAEARLLASEGRLTEAVETEVAAAVKTHSENAQREIEALKVTDADEAALASLQLDTALDVQSASLRSEEQASTSVGIATARLATLLEATREESAAEAEVTLPSYDRLMARVETDTTRAYELLQNIESAATARERRDIERRLADIERSFSAVSQPAATTSSATSTVVSATTTEPADLLAREQLLDILRRTQRLIVFMTNIDVRSSVAIDELVPVVPTEEERRLQVNASLKQSSEALAQLTPLIDSFTEPAMIEKYEIAIISAREAIDSATSSLAAGTLAAAERAAATAADTVADMAALVASLERVPENDAADEATTVEDGALEDTDASLSEPLATGTPATSTPPVAVPEPSVSESTGATTSPVALPDTSTATGTDAPARAQ